MPIKKVLQKIEIQKILKTITTKYGRKLILMYSKEHIMYLKKEKRKKIKIIFFQIIIPIIFLSIWQILTEFKFINTFLFSSPKNIINTIIKLSSNNLLDHMWITFYETLISFLLASFLGLLIATILWFKPTIAKIIEPYLTIINSLPKVALGPLIIIWVGASINSIIVMSLMISLFISIINIYNSFISTDETFIILFKSLKANKYQLFYKLILPANKNNIFNTLKINISMSLIGVIMGELLVSKKGLGYLIMYGSQVFNIDLIITSVFILGLFSYLIYFIINIIEKYYVKKK